MHDTSSHHQNKGQKAYKKRDANKPKVPRKISERYLHNSGLAYLQRFATSSAHFKTVMMRKIDKSCRHHTDQDRDICEEWLDKLILKFQDLELLNDEAFIRGTVTSSRRRGLSSMKIKQKLMMKGVKTDTIETAIKTHDELEYESDEEGDTLAAVTFIRKKKFGAFDIEKKKDFDKCLASMARYGFQYTTANKILKMSLEDLEENFSAYL
jgi:regulatory protein